MAVITQLDEARQRHQEAVDELETWNDKILALADDATDEEQEFVRSAFNKKDGEVRRWKETVERLEVIARAKREIKAAEIAEQDGQNGDGKTEQRGGSVSTVKEPLTYRKGGPHSFFTDLYRSSSIGGNSQEARNRLDRHAQEMRVEQRDITTGDPGGVGAIPPVWLASMWIDLPRVNRPVADAVPKISLPENGMALSLPRLTTGTAVAVQASENAAVQETDADTEVYSVPIRTIAGQQDLSRQLFDRSMPGMDEVIFRDLMNAYDGRLDLQLLSGTGASGQHTGIQAISGINTVTYTDSTPTSAELLPKIYDAIQQVATTRFMQPTAIIMHPRRAAWLASNLSSTFPLFQLGTLNQASGTQASGFVNNFAGLRVILDPNISTNIGTGTNEDEIYVVVLEDLLLAEGPVQTRVFEDVGSGTLTVRLSVFGYSAFAVRLAASIARIRGTGLQQPAF